MNRGVVGPSVVPSSTLTSGVENPVSGSTPTPLDVELTESPEGRLPAGIVAHACAWASTFGAAPLGEALADGDAVADGNAVPAVGPPRR